jgi:putative endonuclease
MPPRNPDSAAAAWWRGEQLAAAYLRGLGYRVLARNVRTRRAEVDIVATAGTELVFVEVKRWLRTPLEALEHAIDFRKRARIMSVARYFVAKQPQLQQYRCRFDVLLVRPGGPPLHLRGAFEA